MDEGNSIQAYQEAPAPSLDLKNLDKLVGTWRVSGPDISGQVKFEWLEGGFFLLQHVDFIHGGREIKGLEVIGHERQFGQEPGEEIKSRFYDNTGDTLDYIYELEGGTLTIWGGQKGSPAYFRGTFSNHGDTLAGGWVYPGGGYEATMTRLA